MDQLPQQVQDLKYEHLVVHGLESSVNDADLREYFEQFGKVAVAKVSICVYVCACMAVASSWASWVLANDFFADPTCTYAFY